MERGVLWIIILLTLFSLLASVFRSKYFAVLKPALSLILGYKVKWLNLNILLARGDYEKVTLRKQARFLRVSHAYRWHP